VADRLDCDWIDHYYRIYWVSEIDIYDNCGAILGQEGLECIRISTPKQLKKKVAYAEDDREHTALTWLIYKEKLYDVIDQLGYGWKSKRGALKTLRRCRAELKSIRDDAPWPEWAKRAVAEGFKPPKGWRPGA